MMRLGATMQNTIDPRRLCQAADALLDAMSAPEGPRGVVVLHTGAESQAPPGAYKPAELVEAMSMLLRLGLVRRDPPD